MIEFGTWELLRRFCHPEKCVNHFKRVNQRDLQNWYVPEEKDVETVSESQILAKNLNVLYPLNGTRVRCIITQDIVDMINEKIDDL